MFVVFYPVQIVDIIFLPSVLLIGLYLIVFIVIFIVNVVAIGTHNTDAVSVECIDCCCSTTNFRLRASKK